MTARTVTFVEGDTTRTVTFDDGSMFTVTFAEPAGEGGGGEVNIDGGYAGTNYGAMASIDGGVA